MEISEHQMTEESAAAPGYVAHIGRPKTGWTVGIDALASPICG
jgi:hypothetical protein